MITSNDPEFEQRIKEYSTTIVQIFDYCIEKKDSGSLNEIKRIVDDSFKRSLGWAKQNFFKTLSENGGTRLTIFLAAKIDEVKSKLLQNLKNTSSEEEITLIDETDETIEIDAVSELLALGNEKGIPKDIKKAVKQDLDEELEDEDLLEKSEEEINDNDDDSDGSADHKVKNWWSDDGLSGIVFNTREKEQYNFKWKNLNAINIDNVLSTLRLAGYPADDSKELLLSFTARATESLIADYLKLSKEERKDILSSLPEDKEKAIMFVVAAIARLDDEGRKTLYNQTLLKLRSLSKLSTTSPEKEFLEKIRDIHTKTGSCKHPLRADQVADKKFTTLLSTTETFFQCQNKEPLMRELISKDLKNINGIVTKYITEYNKMNLDTMMQKQSIIDLFDSIFQTTEWFTQVISTIETDLKQRMSDIKIDKMSIQAYMQEQSIRAVADPLWLIRNLAPWKWWISDKKDRVLAVIKKELDNRHTEILSFLKDNLKEVNVFLRENANDDKVKNLLVQYKKRKKTHKDTDTEQRISDE